MATKMGIKVIPYSALGEEKESYLMKRSGDGFWLNMMIIHGNCITMIIVKVMAG